MLALNSYWYSVLLGKAFAALSKKKDGEGEPAEGEGEGEGEGEAQGESTGRMRQRVILEPRLSTTTSSFTGKRKDI